MSKVSPERAKSSQNALLVMFFFQGVITTTQIPRVPQLIDQIGVKFDEWGLIMGFAAVGSIIGLSIANRLIARFGAQRVSQLSAATVCALLMSYAFTTNPLAFFVTNILWALAMSCFNISINSQCVILQNAIKRMIIGRLHGTWAIGAMLSVALAGYLTTVTSIQVHFLVIGLVCLAAFIGASRYILSRSESESAERTKRPDRVAFFKMPAKVWLLSLGFFASVSPELALIDWSAVFSRDAFGIADSGLRSIPYTTFMVFMIVGRLSISRLTKRWHISHLASVGGVTAFAGFGLSVLLAPSIASLSPFGAVIGGAACWAVAGLGCSTLVPSFFSASGHVKGMDTATVLARMSLAQTFIVIVAKILIGAIAQNAGIREAFIVPCILTLIAALIARIFARDAKRNDVVVADAFPITVPIAILGE
jgi:MFS family permease